MSAGRLFWFSNCAQANRQTPSLRYLDNAPVPPHRQVNLAAFPLRVDAGCRLQFQFKVFP
jgi:hypothetical protein